MTVTVISESQKHAHTEKQFRQCYGMAYPVRSGRDSIISVCFLISKQKQKIRSRAVAVPYFTVNAALRRCDWMVHSMGSQFNATASHTTHNHTHTFSSTH